jgi:hypothetical protein
MTLCIAAVCEDLPDTQPKIVLCTDMERQTEGIGSSETEDKLDFVRPGWPTLVAGTIPKGHELVNVYAEYLDAHYNEINEFNLVEYLRKPVHIQKLRLVDHYFQQTFSFTSAYFYGEGKTKLPESFILEQEVAVSRIKLEASLIIAGFIAEGNFLDGTKAPRPFLCVVDEDRLVTGTEDVTLESEYDAIGSGHYPAISNLYRRSQDSINSLIQTLYNVYEANCLSDKVPGVGREFVNIDVLYADGSIKSVSDAGYKYLKGLFRKFGPKPIKSEQIEFKQDFLEAFDTGNDDPESSAQKPEG